MKLFHVTTQEWGKSKTLKPRTPASRAYGEPSTPRICVAPTVAQAVLACEGVDCLVAIYYTEATGSKKAISVPDAYVTNERWYTKPTEFKLYKRIPSEALVDAPMMPMWGVGDIYDDILKEGLKRFKKWTKRYGLE